MVEPMIYEIPCWLDEALNYAKRKVNGIKYNHDDRLIDPDKAKRMDTQIQTLDSITIHYPELFTWLNHTQITFADILLHSYGLTMEDMVKPDFKPRLIQAMEHIIQSKVGTVTLEHYLDFDLEHPTQPLLDGLMKLSLDDADKLKLIDVLFHPSKSIDHLIESLDPLIQTIQSMVETIDIQPYLNHFKSEDALKFLDNANVMVHGPIIVFPSLINHRTLAVNITSKEQIVVIIGLSIDFNQLSHFDFYQDEMDMRLENLSKVLADKSKMKLIALLKTKPMYGAQLAAAMHLKPSTISYHLDTLMNAGMVKTRRENNRIWFEYDKDHTLMLLDDLRHYFE